MILAALLGVALAAATPSNPFPRAAESYVVAIDGSVVWEKDAATPRPPASLTKLMTALVVLDGSWDPGAVVVVSARAAKATGSRAGLRPGERLAARDLLAAMLVASANDACVALAEQASGSVADFVSAMNARAREMGLGATRFANPCGHDDPNQRSSARDLLALAQASLANATIARTAALRETTITTERGRRIRLENGNHLLGNSRGVVGLKTGYTPAAGKCLIVAAEREGTRVLIVLLDAPDRWWTAAALVEEAFDAAIPSRD